MTIREDLKIMEEAFLDSLGYVADGYDTQTTSYSGDLRDMYMAAYARILVKLGLEL